MAGLACNFTAETHTVLAVGARGERRENKLLLRVLGVSAVMFFAHFISPFLGKVVIDLCGQM